VSCIRIRSPRSDLSRVKDFNPSLVASTKEISLGPCWFSFSLSDFCLTRSAHSIDEESNCPGKTGLQDLTYMNVSLAPGEYASLFLCVCFTLFFLLIGFFRPLSIVAFSYISFSCVSIFVYTGVIFLIFKPRHVTLGGHDWLMY